MMRGQHRNHIVFYQVDAFTNTPFKGNPAAVCLLKETLEDSILQDIAAEMNLSETAFLQPLNGMHYLPDENVFKLRWFTPEVEVPLCGHATLAASKVLFDEIGICDDVIIYETLSGRLFAKRDQEKIILDFPVDEPLDVSAPLEILHGLGIKDYEKIIIGKSTKKLVIQVANTETIYNLKPDFMQMKNTIAAADFKGVAVTAYDGGKYDFVSRYFNPWAGVDEDPVTGSVHTLLFKFWKDALNKSELRAYQASKRGGEIILRHAKYDRVELIGDSTIVLRGELVIN